MLSSTKPALFEVQAFDTKLQPNTLLPDTTGVGSKLLKLVGLGTQPRAPLSLADPENMVKDESIKVEDDVLHIESGKLPHFNDLISSRDSELLLQYLTAPYLRIPLVLRFFADQARVNALSNPELQKVLDACLFEAGQWQPLDFVPASNYVPAKNRDHLATPAGLLFNELKNAPVGLLETLSAIFEMVLLQDTGRYDPAISTAPVILYVLRVIVRVEAYVAEMQEYNASDPASRQSILRGLNCSASTLELLAQHRKKLRSQLDEEAFPILERWLEKATRAKNIAHSCVIHAHLILICQNISEKDLDLRTAGTLLASQIFLTHNFRYNADAAKVGGPVDRLAAPDQSDDLLIPQTEMFDVFQMHRAKLMRWLAAHPALADQVMEAVVRVASFTGTRTGPNPNADAAVHSAFKQPRHWVQMQGDACGGRFIPDTEVSLSQGDKTAAQQKQMTYREWMEYATNRSFAMEVNMQLGEYTLKRQQPQLLDPEIGEYQDFVDLFGKLSAENPIRCADVKISEHRRWLRLVGRRHDVILWDQYLQPPSNPFKPGRPYCPKLGETDLLANAVGSVLLESEKWVKQVLEPYRLAYFPHLSFWLPTTGSSGSENVVRMFAIAATDGPRGIGVLKELVVYRSPKMVNLFNICEYGRRWYRSLVFTSNPMYCLDDLPPVLYDGLSLPPHFIALVPRSAQFITQDSSLVITRLLKEELGVQQLIPGRYLRGQIPAVLVALYTFWQNEDDSLSGEPTKLCQMTTGPAATLTVKLCDSAANVLGWGTGDGFATISRAGDDKYAPMTLLNLQLAPEKSALRRVADLFTRLDNISHILVWSKRTPPIAEADDLAIERIELPRVRLSFSRGMDGRLYSEQHSGYFVSNERSRLTCALLEGVQSSLLLENAEGELFIICAATGRPIRPIDGLFPSQVLFDRSNRDWISRLPDIRHYLYPLHLSRTLLFTPTLASALYLLLIRFITRQYEAVFRMADSCVSDIKMTDDEEQLFQQLFHIVSTDTHPDAYACRLRVWLALNSSSNLASCPWEVVAEMKGYCSLQLYAPVLLCCAESTHHSAKHMIFQVRLGTMPFDGAARGLLL
jgi:hypothetical protein